MIKIISQVICLFLLAGCNQVTEKEENKNTKTQESIVKTSDSISANQKWKQAINHKDIELLSSLYTDRAMVLSENGVDLGSKKEILQLIPKVDFIVKKRIYY